MGSHSAETEQVPALSIQEQMANAVAMIAPYEHTPASGARHKVDEAQDAALLQAAGDIFDTLGVSQEEDVVRSWDHDSAANRYLPRSAVRLRRAADVAGEAISSGYSPDLPEDELRAKAAQLVTDYQTYTAQNMHNRNTDPRYGERRKAKELLIESAARELARRNGVDDSLTPKSMREIQAATGMPLVEQDDHFSFRGVVTPRATVLPRLPRAKADTETHDWYYIPELAGPRRVPGRLGSFVLDARYTGGRLPR